MDYTSFLQLSYFGNTLQDYLVALGVFLVSFGALKIFKDVVVQKLKKLAETSKNDFDDLLIEIIRSIGNPMYLLVAVGVALQFIDQPPFVKTLGFYIALAVVAYTVIRAIQQLVDYIFTKGINKRLVEDADFDPSAVRVLSRVLKWVIWGIAILLLAQNLGYDITALVAGLGIGGIAIAFALQNILSDIFSSFSLYFDKPFSTGDFIVAGNDMGTVKHIGIKSTRLQTLQGEELIIPNKDLTGSRVNNYRKMEKRRVVFSFGVAYETPGEKLRKIPEIVQEILGGLELADLDRVHFKEFGDFSLNYEVVYYANTTEYGVYMDMQQEINLKIKERLEGEGIEFAYPTQTVYMHSLKK